MGIAKESSQPLRMRHKRRARRRRQNQALEITEVHAAVTIDNPLFSQGDITEIDSVIIWREDLPPFFLLIFVDHGGNVDSYRFRMTN